MPELLKTIGFVMFLGRWRPELLKNNWFCNVSGRLEPKNVEIIPASDLEDAAIKVVNEVVK